MHRTAIPLVLSTLLLVGNAAPTRADDNRLDEQRAAFRVAYARAELGEPTVLSDSKALLESYVLWPDLEAAWLQARLQSTDRAEIHRFLERHRALKPARTLRYYYALELGKKKHHSEFLQLYAAHYRELGVARLDCLAVLAEIEGADSAEVRERARALWLVGRSQVDECDPLFDRLRHDGQLDTALYRQRFELAIDARSLSLARYLARSLPPTYQQEARQWTQAFGTPGRFLEQHRPADDSASYRRQLVAAVEALAYDDPLAATDAWRNLATQYDFAADTRAAVARHLALWQARNHVPVAGNALDDLPPAAVDDEVLRWQVRLALAERNWSKVSARIAQLPAAERSTQQWRYWAAIAQQQSGDRQTAQAALQALAGLRSYYGFLAADALGSQYAFAHRDLPADEAVIARLAAQPALIRARELYRVNLDGRGRSEWDAALGRLPPGERVQAAILAHRWGWHSRAIATAADQTLYDDLQIRYPLPYANAFEQHAAAAGIRPSWAYGVARSESLFMRDVRSGAGALGVMQLTPSTGRQTAAELREPYGGRRTLLDPAINIRLGTWYLGKLYARFDRNPALATAAYNAGPARVQRWLPADGDLDARIWVELIPYQQTRDYVRRVLTADTIFHWRMAGELRRLSSALPRVAARAKVASLAH